MVTPVSVYATPAFSSPSPSTIGLRPAANKIVSASRSRTPPGAPPPWTSWCSLTRCGPPRPGVTVSTRAHRRKRTPSRSNCVCKRAATSESSRCRSCAPRSTSVTRAPRRAIACASSQPFGPPPITSRRPGADSRSKIVSLVSYPASLSPGTSGTTARPPVAMTMWRVVRILSPTRTSWGDSSVAWPRNTSTPSRSKRSTESCGSMRARSDLTRRTTRP